MVAVYSTPWDVNVSLELPNLVDLFRPLFNLSTWMGRIVTHKGSAEIGITSDPNVGKKPKFGLNGLDFNTTPGIIALDYAL